MDLVARDIHLLGSSYSCGPRSCIETVSLSACDRQAGSCPASEPSIRARGPTTTGPAASRGSAREIRGARSRTSTAIRWTAFPSRLNPSPVTKNTAAPSRRTREIDARPPRSVRVVSDHSAEVVRELNRRLSQPDTRSWEARSAVPNACCSATDARPARLSATPSQKAAPTSAPATARANSASGRATPR